MKKLLILLLIIPVVLAQTCEKDNGCSLECPFGDPDCSCQMQEGFTCEETQFCPATNLKNWDNEVCCTESCLTSEELPEKENTQTLKTIENPKEFETTSIEEKTSNLGFLAFLLSLIIVGIIIKSAVKIKLR